MSIPAVQSTLSISDGNNMLAHMFSKHSQNKLFPLVDFLSFFTMFVESLKTDLDGQWLEEMDKAVSAIQLLTPIVSQTMNDELRLRAFTSILALANAVDKTPSLDFFRTNAIALIEAGDSPFVLTKNQKTIAAIYMQSVFMFWLCFDQMQISAETKPVINQKLETALAAFANDHEVTCKWFKSLMISKFNPRVRTVMTDDDLVEVEDYSCPVTSYDTTMLTWM